MIENRADLFVAWSKHLIRVWQQRAPFLSISLCNKEEQRAITWQYRHHYLITIYRQSKIVNRDIPLSNLRLQGSSKLFLTSGQLARDFQPLAKSTAVASGDPLTVMKSSAWILLKFPHKPSKKNGDNFGHLFLHCAKII